MNTIFYSKIFIRKSLYFKMRNKIWFDSKDIVTYETLNKSLYECKRNTFWKDSTINAYFYPISHIVSIYDNFFNENGYEHPPMYHTTINERGKERLICSLSIDARIIQKTINQLVLLKVLTPRFINENCASLKGKGTDYAINKCKSYLKQACDQYDYNVYVMKLDIHNYFDTIPHSELKNILDPFISHDKYFMAFFDRLFELYQYDPYIHNGDTEPYGIGLGGEIPQTFGITFLNKIDHYFKEEYHFKFYIRYMDDIIVMSSDKDKLIDAQNFLIDYLNNFHMELNMKKSKISHLRPGSNGFKFLKIGFRISPTNEIIVIPNKKTEKRLKRKLYSLKVKLDNEEITFDDICAMYFSTVGSLQKGNSFHVLEYVESIFSFLYDSNMNDKVKRKLTHIIHNNFAFQ